MDIKTEKEKAEKEIAYLEKQIADLSFPLKAAKAKLRKWQSLETKAQEIANQ